MWSPWSIVKNRFAVGNVTLARLTLLNSKIKINICLHSCGDYQLRCLCVCYRPEDTAGGQ